MFRRQGEEVDVLSIFSQQHNQCPQLKQQLNQSYQPIKKQNKDQIGQSSSRWMMIRDWLPKSCHSPGDGSDGPAWPRLPITRWEDPAGHVIVATCGRLWRIIIITYLFQMFCRNTSFQISKPVFVSWFLLCSKFY